MGLLLKAPAASSEQEIENDQQDDEIDTAPAVITQSRAHVITAATEQQQKDHKNDYQHARKSTIGTPEDAGIGSLIGTT
jgi:hypothetical protein